MRTIALLVAFALLATTTPLLAQTPRERREHIWLPLVLNSRPPTGAPEYESHQLSTPAPGPTPFPTPSELAPQCTFADVGSVGTSCGPFETRFRIIMQAFIRCIDYSRHIRSCWALLDSITRATWDLPWAAVIFPPSLCGSGER